MGVREQGLRRVAAVTTGLATAGVAGSLALAAVARADTHAAPVAPATTSTTGSTTDEQSTSDSGPTLSRGYGQPHAKSGGS
jgi:hypothetical protein